MSEMVERVARAMEPNAFAIHDRGYTRQDYWADSYPAERAFINAEKTVSRARKKARAAIEAMREPTVTMLLDGGTTLISGGSYEPTAADGAAAVYASMIDAALDDEKPGPA